MHGVKAGVRGGEEPPPWVGVDWGRSRGVTRTPMRENPRIVPLKQFLTANVAAQR